MAYQVGQLVETPLGVGTIKEVRNTINKTIVYLVQIGNTCDIFDHNEVELYHPASLS